MIETSKRGTLQPADNGMWHGSMKHGLLTDAYAHCISIQQYVLKTVGALYTMVGMH